MQVARRGANLALAGLEPDRLRDLTARIGSDRAAWFEADVRDWASLEKAAVGTVERFGRIDVVVANAGIAPVGLIQTIDPADFERTIDVDLLGVWRTVRVVLPHVVERRGHVLAVASSVIRSSLWSPGNAVTWWASPQSEEIPLVALSSFLAYLNGACGGVAPHAPSTKAAAVAAATVRSS